MSKEKITDYVQVVHEVAEEILSKLKYDADGSIIETFQTDSYDPWQLFLYFGVLEEVLTHWRTDKRCKNVIVYAQPEGLAGATDAVTPVKTLMQHVAYKRLEDVQEGRLEFGEITYDGTTLQYDGNADLKNRHCVVICDITEPQSPYMKECMALCHEMKASHVIALPLMVWNTGEKGVAKGGGNHENTPVS